MTATSRQRESCGRHRVLGSCVRRREHPRKWADEADSSGHTAFAISTAGPPARPGGDRTPVARREGVPNPIAGRLPLFASARAGTTASAGNPRFRRLQVGSSQSRLHQTHEPNCCSPARRFAHEAEALGPCLPRGRATDRVTHGLVNDANHFPDQSDADLIRGRIPYGFPYVEKAPDIKPPAGIYVDAVMRGTRASSECRPSLSHSRVVKEALRGPPHTAATSVHP
jgi:hypothetical protein